MKKLDSGFWYDLRTLQSYNNVEDVLMGVTREVSKSLKSLSNAWKDTEAKKGYAEYPDGDYIGKPTVMEVGLSKNNRLQVVTTFVFQDGKYKDEEYKKFDGIQDEVAIGWFKGYCEVLGIEIPDDMEDLPETLEAFIENNESSFHLTLKSKDGYQNCYVKGSADDLDLGTDTEEVVEEEPIDEEEAALEAEAEAELEAEQAKQRKLDAIKKKKLAEKNKKKK